MSREVNSLDELAQMIQKDVNTIMKTDMEKLARRTLKENVIEEVYEKYEPDKYERTGGLYQDENINSYFDEATNELSIRSVRHENDSRGYRDIAQIIETGEGYDWKSSRIAQSQQARPFHEITANELRDGLAEETLRQGLRKMGYDTD